jgi:outer membrane lipoprotein-sorting protein
MVVAPPGGKPYSEFRCGDTSRNQETNMHIRMTAIGLMTALAALTITAHAQSRGAAAPTAGIDKQLAEIFGKNRSFSATAVSTIKDASGKEVMSMESDFAAMDGNVRFERDMTKSSAMKGQPEAAAQMAAMGMHHTVSIIRADKQVMYMVYPGKKAYWEMALPQSVAADDSKTRIEKKEAGRETVDGHPCVKQQLTYTDAEGKATQWTLWEAADMNGFPVQTEVVAGGNVITTLYKNINQSKPAASLFEPPADFKRFASMQEMMMDSMR